MKNLDSIIKRWATGQLKADSTITRDQVRAVSLLASGSLDDRAAELAGSEFVAALKASQAPRKKHALGEGLGVNLKEARMDGTTKVYPWVLSTTRVDADGDIVKQNWDLERYRRNPVILDSHNYYKFPIGRMVSIAVEGDADTGRLVGEVGIPLGVSAEIDAIARSIDADLLRAGSVGFMAGSVTRVDDPDERQALGLGRNGVVINSGQLLEYSLCSIGSNADALRRAVGTKSITAADAEFVSKAFAQNPEREEAKLARVRFAKAFPEFIFLDDEPDAEPEEKQAEGELEVLLTARDLSPLIEANTRSNTMLAKAITDIANRLSRAASSDDGPRPEPKSDGSKERDDIARRLATALEALKG